MEDPFDPARFLRAQEGVIDDALAELRAGRKRTHWMWFVFPQLRGLGRSERARFYGLSGAAEARAYLAHPVLGPRLREGLAAVEASGVAEMAALFGEVDAAKFRSCLTLFAAAAEGPAAAPFEAGLAAWYGGRPDPLTLRLLEGGT